MVRPAQIVAPARQFNGVFPPRVGVNRTHDEPGGDVQLVQLVKIYQLVGAPTMSLGEIR